MVKLVCVAIAEKGGQREYGFSGGGGRVGLEYFKDTLTPRAIGEQAAREALLLLEAVDAPAGEMPIVLAPGHSGVLIHEAVGHLLEADFNRKKTSVFWNKMGKKVGSDLVTIYDDPTIPAFRGSYDVDDEGTVPRRTLLIEKGVVRGFLQDRLSAGIMGRPLTGHGRRQDYTHAPIPRMANTYIARGEHAPEEILKSVKKGFYVASLSGRPGRGLGQVHLLRQPRATSSRAAGSRPPSSRRPSSARTSTSSSASTGPARTSPSASRRGPAARRARTSRSRTAARPCASRR